MMQELYNSLPKDLQPLVKEYVGINLAALAWVGRVCGSLKEIEEALSQIETPTIRSLEGKIIENVQEGLRITLEEADRYHKYCPY
jgi:hypothetical protein